MDVGVVGAGRVGTALAVLFRRTGHRIVGIAGRTATAARAARYLPGAPLLPAPEVARRAELILLGVPDGLIAEACVALASEGAFRTGTWVAHLSGATGLDALSSARDAGTGILSWHPLQTFPDVDSAVGSIPGSGVAVTAEAEAGYELGQRLAADVGARPFRLPDELKPLYHAAAVFASNYVVAVTAVAEDLFEAAGLPDRDLFMPLWRATTDNIAELGTKAALTGPAVRGDAGTIARNLEALERLAPSAIPAYVALARIALEIGQRQGRLSAHARGQVEEVLARWT